MDVPDPPPTRDRPAAIISPSILASDFARLADECQRIVSLGADWLHVDVMDGHFVPNLTIGAPVVSSLRKHTPTYLDCHLMVSDPGRWVQDFASAGANMFTFHLEAVADPVTLTPGQVDQRVAGLAAAVRAAGMQAGVALKPATPAELVLPYVEAGLIDLVLVLTVEPGFGGQSFMREVVDKCRVLRKASTTLHIEVDGGISPTTASAAADAGANVLVAGTAVFGSPEPGRVMTALRDAVEYAVTAAVAGEVYAS